MIKRKLLFDGEGMILLIEDDVNLLSRIFLVRRMSKFFVVGLDSFTYSGFSIKVWGHNGV